MRIVRLFGWTLATLAFASIVLAVLVRRGMRETPISTQMRMLRLYRVSASIQAYVLDVQELPASLSELVASNRPGWAGPYLSSDTLMDADGIAVSYAIIDAKTCRYRVAIPEHESRAGTPMPKVDLDDECVTQAASSHPASPSSAGHP